MSDRDDRPRTGRYATFALDDLEPILWKGHEAIALLEKHRSRLTQLRDEMRHELQEVKDADTWVPVYTSEVERWLATLDQILSGQTPEIK